MKKLAKVIAAISAAAILTTPVNMTAYAYTISSRNFKDGKPMVNKSTEVGRGQRWDYFSYQNDLPKLEQGFLDWKGNYTFLATVDTNGNEYGNCDMFAMLDRNVALTPNIAKARDYVDNITVKSQKNLYYAVVMEYDNNSSEDSYRGTNKEYRIKYELGDYALRMLEGPYLQNILNKMYCETSDELNYSYMKKNNGYDCTYYLDNYYIAGMRLTSSDPYTRFEEPVLEPHPSGRGFRTKIECHISTPYREGDAVFGSTSGNYSFNVLSNVKMTCNGSGTSGNCIDDYTKLNIGQRTISVPKSEFDKEYTLYAGLIGSYDLETRISGNVKSRFLENAFTAAKVSNGVLNIYIGKKTDFGDPKWDNGTTQEQFEVFFRCGGRDNLGHSRWVRNQLSSVTQVRFYRDCTPTYAGRQFYSYTPSSLLDRLNNG